MNSLIVNNTDIENSPFFEKKSKGEKNLSSFLGESDNPTFKSTFVNLGKLSCPVIVTYILELLPGLANSIVAGHLGEDELASVSLASMFCNVTGISVGFGLASAMDTLCSQICGSDNRDKLGVILQRALLIEALLCLPVALLWIYAEPILLSLGQDARVAELSGIYCQAMLLGLYPLLIYEVQKKFLQSQGVVLPQLFIAIISNIWSFGSNYIFIYTLDWGFIGAPLARASTHILLCALSSIYILLSKEHSQSYRKCNKECLQKWGNFLSLGIPGMLMMCLEWWAFEILGIYAGLLGTTELAVQSIIYNVVMIVYLIPYGTSVSSNIIVGNSLGKGWPKTCYFVTWVSLASVAVVEIVLGIVIIALREYIPKIFTKEEAIIELSAKILPLVAVYEIFDGLAICASGILRGCGKQHIGAIYNFVGYFMLGLSLSALGAFLTDLRLIGLWLGFGIAIVTSALIALFFVFRINWDQEVINANERVLFTISH